MMLLQRPDSAALGDCRLPLLPLITSAAPGHCGPPLPYRPGSSLGESLVVVVWVLVLVVKVVAMAVVAVRAAVRFLAVVVVLL